MSPFFKTWTCFIILYPLNKHSATLTRIWNSPQRHIPNSSLNAQNDRMKRCRAVFTSHPQISFLFSLSLFSLSLSLFLSRFLMELYWVWTRGNLVRVKSRCRDASLLTLAQFHFQYQRSWNVSDFLSPTQKSSQSTLSAKKMFWNMEFTPDVPRRCVSGSTRCADVVNMFFSVHKFTFRRLLSRSISEPYKTFHDLAMPQL